MTIKTEEIRANLTRLADFFDGRTNGGPDPKLQVTKGQLLEIKRNPAACGCTWTGNQYYFRTYPIEGLPR